MVLKGLARATKQEGKGGIQIGKEEVRGPLLMDYIILYLRSLKTPTMKKILELINIFSKMVTYKINTHKQAPPQIPIKSLLERKPEN